jgi:hypothetical protein
MGWNFLPEALIYPPYPADKPGTRGFAPVSFGARSRHRTKEQAILRQNGTASDVKSSASTRRRRRSMRMAISIGN